MRSLKRPAAREARKLKPTTDSFQNLIARVGLGAGNQSSGAGYGLYPITRLRILLDFAYRGSWIVRKVVDCPADDMTRAGVDLGSDLDPKTGDKLQRALISKGIWHQINQAVKWGRLYGGALLVPLIDGQDFKTPLRIETVRSGQFKGFIVLDRWMVTPSIEDIVNAADKDILSAEDVGTPRFYDVTADAAALPRMRIHYTRAFRIDGLDLPYWQRLAENLWNLSVIEPLYDRLVAFDSTTQGAAQLVYKAHLRTYKVKDFSQFKGETPEEVYEQMAARVALMAAMQTNEGVSVIDSEEDLVNSTYTFAGLSDMMLQFGQQISGATGIPLVRLFGQSPAGLNATGESDLRTYYDEIAHLQEVRLRRGVNRALYLTARSEGIELPEDFWWEFAALWLLSDEQKAVTMAQTTTAIVGAYDAGAIKKPTMLKELKQASRTTGYWSNITDEDIEEAENEPPAGEMGLPGMEQPGAGTQPGQVSPESEAMGGERPGTQPGEYADIPPPPRLRSSNVVRLNRDQSRAIDWHGLPLYIETFKGQMRRGLRGWTTQMPCDYGFIAGSSSAEGPGEGFDVFVGPNLDAAHNVWVIDQVHPDTGMLDEHKGMIGYASRAAALRDYGLAFSDGSGPARTGGVQQLSVAEFRVWLEEQGYLSRLVAAE